MCGVFTSLAGLILIAETACVKELITSDYPSDVGRKNHIRGLT